MFILGEVYSWGMGSNMQLGMGDDDSDLWIPTKMKGKALENKVIKSVSAGGQHTVLLGSDTSVKPDTASKSGVQNGKKNKAAASEEAMDVQKNSTNEKKSENDDNKSEDDTEPKDEKMDVEDK